MTKKISDYEWDRLETLTPRNIENVKDLLNSTGCGFCLAKFKHVTMHLGNGTVHSCHHPEVHKIPLSELENNPSALFNTNHLKTARKQMLNNERPPECEYCWRVEDNGDNSDRMYKSTTHWALPYHDEITNLTGDENIYPTYLEVDFSNVCNLKCTYCGPEYSSSWVEELKYQGPFKMFEGTKNETWYHGWQDLDSISYKKREFNPYIDAFWKWWPDVYKNLHHYRITGGEPLMSKETFKSIDWLIENPNPNLHFSINTNLCVPEKIWNTFIEKIEHLVDNQKIQEMLIFTSVEGWGKAAEYARTNMDFALFKSRVEQLCEMGNVRCIIMSAFNIFSVTTYEKFLRWVADLKQKYNTEETYNVRVDIPYLRHPTWLDVKNITDELRKMHLIPAYEFMANSGLFHNSEVEKMKNIVHLSGNTDESVTYERAKFYEFVNNMDIRRHTNFIDAFPQMRNFYEICKECAESVNDK